MGAYLHGIDAFDSSWRTTLSYHFRVSRSSKNGYRRRRVSRFSRWWFRGRWAIFAFRRWTFPI